MGQNIYSKLPEKVKDESTATQPGTEPLYSTVTDTLLPANAVPLYESITSAQDSAHQTVIQALPLLQKAAKRDETQEKDGQLPVYSTIVRQEDGKKVTATIIDHPHRPQNVTAPNMAATSDQPSMDAPKTNDTVPADSDPPEDKLYSMVTRLDGKKVTVRAPAPKEEN